MKKILLFLNIAVFGLILLLNTQKISAVETPGDGGGTLDSLATPPSDPNPAPPLEGSIPCGNTVCLADEICVQYPHDHDQHCVSKDIDPVAVKADPEKLPDCWDELGQYNGSFPPNAACWNHVSSIQKRVEAYDKTCIYQPVVQYTDTRYLHDRDKSDGDQGFDKCGNGYAGPNATIQAPGGGAFECFVSMLVYTDVREATLGSYGPDIKTIDEKSSDYLAQNYLFNSLFGVPENLSKTNKEEYRTYWRLLSASTQANLRSYMMNLAKNKLTENINFKFTDTTGGERTTSFVDLYDKLSKQIIIFLHPPFIRIGCLTDYPVCPEYAKAIKDLKTSVKELLEFATNFPFPVDISPAITAYSLVADTFNFDVSGAYAAFTPLDFSGVRDYIVKKKDQFEEEMYLKDPFYNPKLVDNLNASRYGANKPNITNISRESLPYVGAIYQGLLSPKFGIMSSLQPQWLVDEATSGGSLYDYVSGNLPQEFPEVKISQINYLTRFQNEFAAFLDNPLTWTISLVKDVVSKDERDNTNTTFTAANLLQKGYNPPYIDNEKDVIREQYVNRVGCPLPISYHIQSPKTAFKAKNPLVDGVSPDDHHQVVNIAGDHIQWAYTPESWQIIERDCSGITDLTDLKKCERQNAKPCPINDEHYQEGNTCYRRKWSLTAIKDGKALSVHNNPKQTDIKKAIISDDKFSLYKTLLPDSANKKKITDASVDAPIARHFTSYLSTNPTYGKQTATAPTGETIVFNPAEPINRVNNQAQDTMHILQNCWVVPDKLQNSPRCKLALTESAIQSACTGEAFAKIIPNPDSPSGHGLEKFNSEVATKLEEFPELVEAYTEAEKQTGVPCEVLAGIHYREGGNNPEQDLQSGAPLAGRSLTESAVQAATELLGKAGGQIDSLETLMKALSYYNGGGNANCQGSVTCLALKNGRCGSTLACDNLRADATSSQIASVCTCSLEAGSCRSSCGQGYPFAIPSSPGLCPPKSIGYDDPYVTELWKSPEHDKMYVLYKYDCTQTPPENQDRLGTLTTAISYFLSHKK